MHSDIIIVGAGPAGLIAARELAKEGKKVLILEARDRIGGRLDTVEGETDVIERGAEFVHGKLPITLTLLELAGLSYTKVTGKWVQVKSGAPREEREADDWPLLLKKLKGLKKDMTLQDFLEAYFPEAKYAVLKDRALGFAEGYDSADASRASAKALGEEWSKEEEENYRIDKGYSALMDYLGGECEAAGCAILLSHPVSSIMPGDSAVTIGTDTGETFTADKVILALPLGVLQQEVAIRFSPAAPAYATAIQQLGYGDIIKYVFRFKEAFWKEEYPGLGFLFSGAPVPTWWTQAPAESTVLTGWLAGRAARTHAALSTAQLRDLAVESLAQIFSQGKAEVEDLLEEAHVVNWSSDPYSMGSYAYATVASADAIRVLSTPLADRVFFAGEYMYEGPAMGTVEAAFWSGIETARKVLKG